MGKRVWGVLLFVAAALGAKAQTYYAVNGACTLGGQATVTQGMPSSGTRPLRGSTTFNGTGVMASYPGCTVTVFNTGTNNPAQIFSTASGGARSNPFTADLTDGSWVFFAAATCYDITISSGATQGSIMPNSKTFPGVCAGAGSGGGGGGGTVAGTQVTINGTAAVPNALNFSNILLPPANGTVINFQLNGTNAGAYLLGNGSPTTCLLGTGWGACPSGSGGGGGTFPTTPIYDLFASTGAQAAQASGVLGSNGFLRAQVYTATGDLAGNQPAFQLFPNASVEYFPTGYANSQGNFGAANGLALYMSHSGQSSATGNGGVAIGGGNSSGVGNEIYLDCEVAGCDFKVNVTHNGAALGGGGGGATLPTTPSWDLFASNNAGAAQASGVLGQAGFLRAYVLEATGTGTSSPWAVPNGSIEYFPTGGYGAGGANGVALHVSHSGSATGFGGIALAGGNTTGTDQLYVDCEGPPVVPALGCDFKVPITVNGSAVGGGGGGGGVNPATVGQFASYNTTTTVAGNAHISDNGTQITSTEPIAAPSFVTTTPSTGVSMTGSGGTLPTLPAGTGGLGIGPGAVPMMNLGTGADWIAIPSTTGGGGTTVSVNGASQGSTLNLTNSTLINWIGATGTTSPSIVASPNGSTDCMLGNAAWGPCPSGTGGVTNPIVFPGATLSNVASGSGGFGVIGAGYPAIASSGNPYKTAQQPSAVNGTQFGLALNTNFVGTTASPCGGLTIPINGKCINVIAGTTNSGTVAFALVGDGSSNCLSGNGTYVPCGSTGGGGLTGVTPNMGLLVTGNNVGLINTCGAGQVLQYDGASHWTCQNLPAAATLTSINAAPAGATLNIQDSSLIRWTALSGGVTDAHINGSGNSTDCLNGTPAFAPCPGLGAITAATANGGLVASSGTLGMRTDCTSAQYLAYVGGVWQCQSPTGGGGALSGLTAATAGNTIANGNFPQTWNWALTATTPGMAFGETTANTAAACPGTATCPLVTSSTLANSVSTPLTITQAGVPASATSVPALQITTAYPSGAVGNVFGINVSNAASATSNNFFQFNAGTLGTATVAKMDLAGNLALAGNIYSTGQSLNFRACGGNSYTCSSTVSTSLGGAWVQGTDNGGSGAAGRPGLALFRGGMLTNATPNASQTEGPVQIGQGFLASSGAVAAVYNVVCETATGFGVADCSAASPAVNIVGIATSTSPTIGVVLSGSVPVNLDNPAVLGDVVCMSTTVNGQGHDNGLNLCPGGQGIGIVIGTTGTVATMSGASTNTTQAISATAPNLPLVLLRISGASSGTSSAAQPYSCTLAAPVNFLTAQVNICSQALGATAKQWIIHCSIPWTFTAGTGTSNIVIGMTLSVAPTVQTYLNPVMWTTTGASNYGAILVNAAAGNTPIISPTGLSTTGGAIWSVTIDGTIAAAANTTFNLYGTSTVGTASFLRGVACVLQ